MCAFSFLDLVLSELLHLMTALMTHDSWKGPNPVSFTSPGNSDDIKDNRQATCLHQVLFDQTRCRLPAHWSIGRPFLNKSTQQPAEPTRMRQDHMQRGRLVNVSAFSGLGLRKEVDYRWTLFEDVVTLQDAFNSFILGGAALQTKGIESTTNSSHLFLLFVFLLPST